MAVLTVAAFLSKWEVLFASTGNRTITGAKMRDFKKDIADSFQSIIGATTITAWKDPCVVATTVNITLSGEQTIDGVLTSSSRVLVKNQSTTSQNGIYVSAAGAWVRADDVNIAAELEGAAVGVSQGTSNKNSLWLQKTAGITLGTSAIEWQQFGFSSIVNVLDEDDMASNSDTAVPTQQSVKAFVENNIPSLPTITSGTYTPTLTNVANAGTLLSDGAQYMRLGNVVTVSGRLQLIPTASATLTKIGMSLPIASNLGAGTLYECSGTGAARVGGAQQLCIIMSDITNNRAELWFDATSTSTHAFNFIFQYQII